ncbi:hypothetical protein [Nocardia brasiliensis]|uniref:hypothetical protein n=1 Tax=Nocardia brasiliensis TaxID=37326 RepID=UPI0024561BAC|nr:hypothetical protein [Nocardia brasiliensis]
MSEYEADLAEWSSAAETSNAGEPLSGPVRDRITAAAERSRRAQRPEDTSEDRR